MKLETEFFKGLYSRAKLSYHECILNPDNDHLNAEIIVPMDEILLKEASIRLQFFEYDIDRFVVEVKLELFSQENHFLGMYIYCEDEKEVPVDDSLIFDRHLPLI